MHFVQKIAPKTGGNAMKRTVKRILSTLLIVVMLIGVAPMGAFKFTAKASAKTIEECSVGDLITFGSYPQSKVTDEEILNGIKSVEDNYKWIDYNYYAGTGDWCDGNMKPVDGMMLYKDIVYGGNKYRAVKINQYRPASTGYLSTADKSYQDDNGYYTGNTYYFKYEPLRWRVLNPSEGYVMCNIIIDSQAYQNSLYFDSKNYLYYINSEYEKYPSEWTVSFIRQWLNDSFYNATFTDDERALIKTSHIENSRVYDNCSMNFDTDDKIFLISYGDVTSPKYGFDYETVYTDSARLLKGTDYALCQGLQIPSKYSGMSSWWLRTAMFSTFASWTAGYDGMADVDQIVNMTDIGVVPAFKFNPKSTICDVHEYKAIVTEPTCTEQGYTTYTCTKCNDSYVDNYTNALGHDFGEWKLTTPATCTEIGVETRYCTRCDVTQTRDVDKSAHVFGEWKITTAPTTISDGVKTRYCKNCDAFETESVGKLKLISVKLNNIETNYKKSGQLEPKITNPDNVGYKVEYKSSDPKCVIVDADGNYFAVKTGSAKITCTVTDEYGKVTTAECKVNVKYSVVQWIIMIVLFGWIWY